MKHPTLKLGVGIALLCVITFFAFLAASDLDESGWVRSFVDSAGIFGIILVALVGGLNAVVPVPPATFAPLFLEAGFGHATIIICFVIGTFIADSIGYGLGWFGRSHARTSFPVLSSRLHAFLSTHTNLIVPTACLYFALAPLPNEIIVIPLALAGFPYKKLIIPLILGNIVHHTILVFGYQSVFNWLF